MFVFCFGWKTTGLHGCEVTEGVCSEHEVEVVFTLLRPFFLSCTEGVLEYDAVAVMVQC